MPHEVPFRLVLTGDTADQHQFQGYDGYMALAGFAWTLSLISNYVETGEVRHRGDFPGRHSVRAKAIGEGSVLAEFAVWMQQNPELAMMVNTAGALTMGMAGNFLYDVAKRVIGRNLGENVEPQTELMQRLLATRGGDVEALVAATEPAIRQSHSVIGNGAQVINIYGGSHVINKYDKVTKDYVLQNVEDRDVKQKDFSVAAFNVNSGYGSVFDFDLGRTVPISMSKEVSRNVSAIFTWGLDQYANSTERRISVKYWRILAMDGTPKRYVVLDAEKGED